MKTKLKSELGTWKLVLYSGKKSYIEIKNQAQARFICDNMFKLDIKEWEAVKNNCPYNACTKNVHCGAHGI